MAALPSTTALRVVAALAQHGTVSAAAEGIGLTQSAVSKQLKSIEALVGVKSLGTVTPVSRRIPTPWKTGPSLSTWGHRRDPRPERSAFALREAEGVGGACAPTWVSSEADLSFVF